MYVTTAITAGLVVWLVLWSLGAKAIDAFMLTIVISLVAATVSSAAKYLPGNRS